MKKRSLVMVLAVALLLVFVVAGTASAYTNKAPIVIESWVGDSTGVNGFVWTVSWSLTDGKPAYAQIVYQIDDEVLSLPIERLKKDELLAGETVLADPDGIQLLVYDPIIDWYPGLLYVDAVFYGRGGTDPSVVRLWERPPTP